MIRVGDIVTVDIRVTEVADYRSAERPDGQQVMGIMLPRGKQVGWLVPQEALVTLKKQRINVGDSVWLDAAQSAYGEVIAVTAGCTPNHAWVKAEGTGVMWTLDLDEVRRV